MKEMFHFPKSHNSSTSIGNTLLIEHRNVSVQFSAVSRKKLSLNQGKCVDISMKSFVNQVFRSDAFFNTTFKNSTLVCSNYTRYIKGFLPLNGSLSKIK